MDRETAPEPTAGTGGSEWAYAARAALRRIKEETKKD